MTKKVLIFIHTDDRDAGYIADFLTDRNIPYRIIRGGEGDVIPLLDGTVAGLVFMGGMMSANDPIPWIEEEIKLIGQALANNIPILGHCLGGQMISKALGEKVTENPVLELGWHCCSPALNSSATHWLGNIDKTFTMFHWHSETFTIPAQGTLLFSSEHCHNQAYSVGDNVLAMQCHVEMTLPVMRSWMEEWRERLTNESPSVQSYRQIMQHLEDNIAALNIVAEQLYRRWVSTLQL